MKTELTIIFTTIIRHIEMCFYVVLCFIIESEFQFNDCIKREEELKYG